MGRCVFCSATVGPLYTRFGEGTIGENVVINPCPSCKRVADPYVQDQVPLLLIDLFLVKPSVYRHLLFNAEIPRKKLLRYSITLFAFDTFFRLWDDHLSSRHEFQTNFQDGKGFMLLLFYQAAGCLLSTFLIVVLSDYVHPKIHASKTSQGMATLKALLLSLVPSTIILALVFIWEPAFGSLPPRLLSPMSRLPAELLASHPRIMGCLPEQLLGRLQQGVGIDMDQLAAPVLKDGLIRGVLRYAGAVTGVAVAFDLRWIYGLALLSFSHGCVSGGASLLLRLVHALHLVDR